MAINAPAFIHYNYDDQNLEISSGFDDDNSICIPAEAVVKYGSSYCTGPYRSIEEFEKALEEKVNNYKDPV